MPSTAETWRGLAVENESRCSVYEAADYSYPASIEREIVEQQGGVWSPYTRRRFASIRETDIEHIVPRSEAHDSGLCARSKDARRGFARDLLNLTLASPEVNRRQKRAFDPADWLPDENRCWYARRWIQVKRKWQLSVDHAERDALEAILGECRMARLQGPER
ncbi:MAG: HNH endonuclease family protein [Gammaproteobacteria bacterium]|nr:HNH endonuclease family protein [Gammaproteobacteria bacterium]